MTSRFLKTASGSVVLLSASVALAGLLPNPPFTTGGNNAPDATVLKQEQSVGKVITGYVAGRTKCDQKAIAALQKFHAAIDPVGVTATETAWTACVAANVTKYNAARDKLVAAGTPTCLNQAGIDAIKTQLDAQLPLLGGIVYCNAFYGTNAVTGQKVPELASMVKSEVGVGKLATKAGVGAGKCYTKAASTVFKNGGTLPAADLTKFNDCITKASAGGTAGVAKLVAGGTLPSCLPGGTATAVVSAAVALGGGFNDETYCQP